MPQLAKCYVVFRIPEDVTENFSSNSKSPKLECSPAGILRNPEASLRIPSVLQESVECWAEHITVTKWSLLYCKGQLEVIHTEAHSLKGIRLILNTTLRMRTSKTVGHIPIGWGVKHNVTHHYPSLLTTPTKCNECPPQPLLIGHKDLPPGLMDNNEGPLIPWGPPLGLMNGHEDPSPPSTRAHHQDWWMAMTSVLCLLHSDKYFHIW